MGEEMTGSTEAAERDANRIIEEQLDERIAKIEQVVDADVLSYIGPMYPPADDGIKDAIEGIESRRSTLMCVLETSGGYIDIAARIARIFRHNYGRVDFLVPSYAMSAGTVLVMSGDAIHMDYASMLGPIDPQVAKDDGGLVPALGYVEEFERLIKKSAKQRLTAAELAYLVQRFDPAELYRYKQERAVHSPSQGVARQVQVQGLEDDRDTQKAGHEKDAHGPCPYHRRETEQDRPLAFA
jgi:hypothetical protein